MTTFDVPQMTCGHCVKTITQAVLKVDPAAEVRSDLSTHTVSVASSATTAKLSDAIASAGYPNSPRF